jgi:GNAT superfamily N-acetyltransferase
MRNLDSLATAGLMPAGHSLDGYRDRLSDGRPVAFCAALASLGHRGRKRISRLVTLPDYQGLGIGLRLAERVCQDQSARGFRISIATSHPAIIARCRSSPQWRPLSLKRLGGTRQRIEGRNVAGSTGRGVASFEWVGEV